MLDCRGLWQGDCFVCREPGSRGTILCLAKRTKQRSPLPWPNNYPQLWQSVCMMLKLCVKHARLQIVKISVRWRSLFMVFHLCSVKSVGHDTPVMSFNLPRAWHVQELIFEALRVLHIGCPKIPGTVKYFKKVTLFAHIGKSLT